VEKFAPVKKKSIKSGRNTELALNIFNKFRKKSKDELVEVGKNVAEVTEKPWSKPESSE
jgi:hypothetical protein